MTFKNIGLLAAGLCLAASGARAESYAGALVELSHYNDGGVCASYATDPAASNCDSSAGGVKVFAGVGAGSSNGIEAAYIDFGRANSTVNGAKLSVRVSSFVIAGVLRTAPLPGLSLNAKLGVAATKALVKSAGASESNSDPSLYMGLGVDYELFKNVKAVGSVDFVRAKVNGERFGVRGIGLGAQVGF